MAVKFVYSWPDPHLTRRAQEVGSVGPEMKALVTDLFDTLYSEDGIGLAANQIGVDLRVVALDVDPHKRAAGDPEWAAALAEMGWRAPFVAIDPRIVARDGNIVWEEGCLSVPGITDEVKRSRHVRLAYTDIDGAPQELDAHDLFAVVIQHEIDHLDGKVFIDRLSRLKQEIYRKRLLRGRDEARRGQGPIGTGG